MKKILQSTLILLGVLHFTTTQVMAQKAYVPDNNFEQALIDLGFDNTLDDSILVSNLDTVTTLVIKGKNIKDLTGIKSFKFLNYLDCAQNQIKVLDVSNMPYLRYLNCSANGMVKLDLTGAVAINNLLCFFNNLRVLNLKTNKAVGVLWCQYNSITHLDLETVGVRNLRCDHNKLTSLNLYGQVVTNVYAVNNPDLSCIAAYYPTQAINDPAWAKDPNAVYQEKCPKPIRTFIADEVFEQILVSKGFDDVADDSALFDVVKDIDTLDLSNSADITNLQVLRLLKS